MDINTLITTVKDGDNVNAERAFNNVMAQKLTAAIDAKKVETASNMVSKKSEEEK